MASAELPMPGNAEFTGLGKLLEFKGPFSGLESWGPSSGLVYHLCTCWRLATTQLKSEETSKQKSAFWTYAWKVHVKGLNTVLRTWKKGLQCMRCLERATPAHNWCRHSRLDLRAASFDRHLMITTRHRCPHVPLCWCVCKSLINRRWID